MVALRGKHTLPQNVRKSSEQRQRPSVEPNIYIRLPWDLRPVGTWRGFLKSIRNICDVDIINKPRMKLSKP